MFRGWRSHAGKQGRLDVLDGVASAGVFGERAIVKVRDASDRVVYDVFEHCPESNGLEDLRLLVLVQPQALGVAAAFDVENALVAPAMLVIADQPAARVGRERGLAGSRESEEKRRVALGALVGAYSASRGCRFAASSNSWP